jgi:hypothetical protein
MMSGSRQNDKKRNKNRYKKKFNVINYNTNGVTDASEVWRTLHYIMDFVSVMSTDKHISWVRTAQKIYVGEGGTPTSVYPLYIVVVKLLLACKTEQQLIILDKDTINQTVCIFTARETSCRCLTVIWGMYRWFWDMVRGGPMYCWGPHSIFWILV